MMNRSWVVEERMALVPVLGKVLAKSLPEHDLVEEKVPFGPHPNQYFYLCWPERAELRKHTAVLFLHGGGWSTGNPFLFRFIGHFFAGQGYPTILGGYRMAPEWHYPAHMDDVTSSLKIGVEELCEHGLEIERVVIGGQSAGGHLASLMVYDHSRPTREVISPAELAGFFSISGPLDFSVCHNPSLIQMIDDLMGDYSGWGAADPVHFIHKDERIPAFLVHGDRDPLVELENTLSFAKRLAHSRTCPVEVQIVRGGHHADLAAMFLEDWPATRAFLRWLARCDRDKIAR